MNILKSCNFFKNFIILAVHSRLTAIHSTKNEFKALK